MILSDFYWNQAHHNHNSGFCMDLENGITTNGHKVQTWKCLDTKNQVWIL